jgi:hypothetical protein
VRVIICSQWARIAVAVDVPVEGQSMEQIMELSKEAGGKIRSSVAGAVDGARIAQ